MGLAGQYQLVSKTTVRPVSTISGSFTKMSSERLKLFECFEHVIIIQ